MVFAIRAVIAAGMVSVVAVQQPPASLAADAANDLMTSLSAEQKAKMHFARSDPRMKTWRYTAATTREGVSLKELDESQKGKFLNLLRVSLSAAGYEKSRNVMALDDILGGYGNDSELYWATVYGTPSTDGDWAWRLEGHHLFFLFAMKDGQMTVSPNFMGANPARVTSGEREGLRALAEEEDRGYELMSMLDKDEQAKAVISAQIPDDIFTGPGREDALKEPAGLALGGLSDAKKAALFDLIRTYVGRLPKADADRQMEKIESTLNQTHLAWMGPVRADQRWYYRIHGPEILIEFDHAGGGGLNQHNHVHSMWHVPGRDYGGDALRAHYAESPHHNGQTQR